MTQAEKFAKVREQAVANYTNLNGQAQIGVGTWAVETEYGWAKITVQAVKGEFDVNEAVANFEFEMQERETKAAQRLAAKEAKVAKAKAKG